MSDATAIDLIAAERARQIAVEGWTPEHDDEHSNGELAQAAACYAVPGHARTCRLEGRGLEVRALFHVMFWPWDTSWWKPARNDRIRELVKAGALIVAEIERLQRKPAPASPEKEKEVKYEDR